ncbi:MAG TPA: DoxX family membrane protein [Bacteroidia bacterium]|nr:DoxX family membrane protein [Bacteroidia bacterium]
MDITLLLTPDTIAPLFTRVFLGILFFMQGYDKIFNIKIANVIETIRPSYHKLKLPDFMIALSAYITSYIELICGLLLIVGFMKYLSLYLLGIDLIIVSFGMSIINSVWNMQLVFPRFLLLLFLLIYPEEFDLISIDNLLTYLK